MSAPLIDGEAAMTKPARRCTRFTRCRAFIALSGRAAASAAERGDIARYVRRR